MSKVGSLDNLKSINKPVTQVQTKKPEDRLLSESYQKDNFSKKILNGYDRFTKKMEELQQPYYNGDGILSGKEIAINEIRGLATPITCTLSNLGATISTIAITGLAVKNKIVSASVMATLGILAGTSYALYYGYQAVKKFINANGNEKTLAEAHLKAGVAISAGISAKASYNGYKNLKTAETATKTNNIVQQSQNPELKQNIPELQGRIVNGDISKNTAEKAITSLHKTMYYSDPDTARHELRVSIRTKKTLKAVNIDPKSSLGKETRLGALSHDEGKLNPKISKTVALPRKLTDTERALVANHAQVGADDLGRTKLFGKLSVDIAKYHHKPWTELAKASLSEEEIRAVQATTFADITDALLGKGRKYLTEITIEEALPLIRAEAVKLIRPDLLEPLMATLQP